ncbi:nucleotidyltransferase family protein [candidate division KSB1 bacterium]|nr:nucleotidyltransferase family protein [candidate division KSB1 bacterium]RQW07873.1 MAG: nucleotidyltransferase family protein [candidate division KSB1 bacterium]
MNAMVLAAGLGTRLLPITTSLPKALVPVAGTPLLGIILHRLKAHGFTHVAVNAHHHAKQVKHFLQHFAEQNDVTLYLSQEPVLLDTGGGIRKMLDFFDKDAPILVHNVDVLTTLHYAHLMRAHIDSRAAATLVINRRQTDRPLSFSSQGDFLGRLTNFQENEVLFGFCGIQVIQPFLFRRIDADRFYSIDAYEKAAQAGFLIRGYDITTCYWRDVGTPGDLQAAEKDIQQERFTL